MGDVTDAAPRQTASMLAHDRLTHGPILLTLISFAAPNAVALCSSAVITICETAYVGLLGVTALAGVTLVFPITMLMQMMSGGALGGAIAGAISRALGAGDNQRARALAFSAFVIGAGAGLGFACLIWLLGPTAYRALGGEGASLEAATLYSNVIALAAVFIWITNTMASIARGFGAMKTPAFVLLGAGLVQIGIGGALAFGLGPLPRLGLAGVALGQVVAFTLSTIALFVFLRRPGRPVPLHIDLRLLSPASFAAILRPGALAALSPIQSVLTVLILTALIARFGAETLAGYGVGSRLEFLLIPVAFSIGIGALPMVGAAIGAGDVARARRVAWMAATLGAAALALIALIVIVSPDLWAKLLVSDGAVLDAARTYLRIGTVGFPFLGVSLCLYFASQGAGKIIGPVLAQTLRLGTTICGGLALTPYDAPVWTLYVLSAAAMAAQGLATAASVRWTNWGAI